jgi:hypothetical protein
MEEDEEEFHSRHEMVVLPLNAAKSPSMSTSTGPFSIAHVSSPAKHSATS